MNWRKKVSALAVPAVAAASLPTSHPPNFWKIGQPCPTAIHGVSFRSFVPWDPDAPADPSRYSFNTMQDAHNALLSCPNISAINIRVVLQGCSDWPDRFNFPFNPQGGDQYPSAPEVLSLEGYDGDEDPWRSSETPKDVRQPNMTNFDLWLDAMDFSRIHTLEFPYTSSGYRFSENMMSKLSSRLPHLHKLHVVGSRTQDFILALPKSSLKELTWRNYETDFCYQDCDARDPPSLELVLQHQGASLEVLDIQRDETDRSPVTPISMEQARQIVKLAPNLRNLTLNLGRKSEGDGHRWPLEELAVLADGLTALTHFTVMFELASECQRKSPRSGWSCKGECLEPERYATPLLNATGVREMVDWLQRHKAGRKLESVRFIAGDWTAGWDGPFYLPEWIEYKRMWVTCLPKDNNDGEQHRRDDNTTEEGDGFLCEDGSLGLRLTEWENHCAEEKWRQERRFRRGWWDDRPLPFHKMCPTDKFVEGLGYW